METGQEVPSDQARGNFRSLLNKVEHEGAHVTILRYKVPAAVLVPVKWHETATSALAALGEASSGE